ncbi:MAG: radical SAM protein [Magnetococcus sp. YQC-3]
MRDFAGEIIAIDKQSTNREIVEKIVKLSGRFSRQEQEFAVYILLKNLEIRGAYLLARMLTQVGSKNAGVSLAHAVGGLLFQDPQERDRGMGTLQQHVDSLTAESQQQFYDQVVSPLMAHLIKDHASNHAMIITFAEILKKSSFKLRQHIVPAVHMEVVSACNYDCEQCTHGSARKQTKKYQMSIAQLKKFIECTEKSNYYIERLIFHGPGEPFLWKHFDEGMALLRQSKHIGHITVQTNGMMFDRIKDSTFDCIDLFYVSLYDKNNKIVLKDSVAHHMHKIDAHYTDTFRLRVQPDEVPMDIPCACQCFGPAIFGDHVFLYCGPVVFDAAAMLGKNVYDMKELYVELGDDYLSSVDLTKKGNMELCRYCWGNNRRLDEEKKRVVQSVKGGNWQ